MFDGLKIRNKLVLLVAGPMVIIVLLAALGARSRQESANRSADVVALVSMAQANAALVDALQSEAIYSAGYVASGRTQWKSQLDEARKKTDTASTAALKALDGPVPEMGSNLRSTSTLASDSYAKMPFIRSTVDAGFTWTQAIDAYQATETSFLIVNEAIAAAVSDPSVGAKLRTASAVASYKATLARQGALMLGGRGAGQMGEVGFDQFKIARSDEQSKLAVLNSLADTSDKGAIRDALTTQGRLGFDAVRASVTGPNSTLAAHKPEEIAADTVAVLDGLHDVEVDLDQRLVTSAEDARQVAERAATLFIAAAFLAVLLAAAAAVVLGRRITRPLRTLTEAADRLSKEQMPKLVESLRNPSEDEMAYQLSGLTTIDVGTSDEIGQLATAFNHVQKVAGEVAAEQAALLRKGIG
ncbi:MAG: nitrate- and nitrite sensing domain-containing protein, partial [Acidimicrobiales bacterium]|nr:nitrate- and nitrite sensing domain-containing protein [Acidimicrobiales bacterium]